MRITDLDKFCLEEVWWPFQSMQGYEKTLKSPPMDLDATARLLLKDWLNRGEWSQCVIRRLANMRVTFASYTKHPLVYVVSEMISAVNERAEAEKGGAK